jgi:hypothetical protein
VDTVSNQYNLKLEFKQAEGAHSHISCRAYRSELTMSNDDFIKFLKYGCALCALTYFIYVFLPADFIVAQHSKTAANVSEWFSRAISFALFLLYGAIFYGLQ